MQQIPPLRGQTLNTVVPTMVWGLAIANATMAVWTLSGLWFWLAFAGLLALAFGSVWATAHVATILRDQTPPQARLLFYGLLLFGMLKVTWESVPTLETEKVPIASEPAGPPVTPVSETEWDVPRLPPGPARLEYVPANVLDLIGEAQRRLQKVPMRTSSCGGSGKGEAQCLCDYLLAVTDSSGKITLVDAYQDRPSTPPGYQVKAKIVKGYERACGTNPVLDVSHPPGQTVLAIRTVVKTVRGGTMPAVFTPFTDELNIPELRERGLAHWWAVVSREWEELTRRGVMSEHVSGKRVVDLVSAKHVFLLGIIENIGVLAPFGDNGTDADRLRELSAVLVMYGANGDDAFKWRVSKADAHGPLQFTPIFKGIARQYPGAGLPTTDWVAGARDHRMSARAAFLHSDEELRPLRKAWYDDLPKHPLLYGLYLAAGYNGSASKASKGLERCSAEEWYSASCTVLRSETRWYLRKYTVSRSVFFDPKTQARLSESQNAPASDED